MPSTAARRCWAATLREIDPRRVDQVTPVEHRRRQANALFHNRVLDAVVGNASATIAAVTPAIQVTVVTILRLLVAIVYRPMGAPGSK